MTLTAKQNKELDSLKIKIESIERKIENAKSLLSIAMDIEDTERMKQIDKSIDFGFEGINKMVIIQCEVMNMEYNSMINLIFDREYTLSVLP